MKIFLILALAVSPALANCRCGKVLDGQVRGSAERNLKNAPYVVSLEFKNIHICSGVAIRVHTFITTARCVTGVNISDLTVRSDSANALSGGNLNHVEEIFIHPDYNSATLENDIAVVKVLREHKFTEVIRLSREIPYGSSASSFGWPLYTVRLNPMLTQVNTPLLKPQMCAITYGFKLSESMQCAGLWSHTHCQGDAGSPLVADGKLVGLASFGYGCSKAAPGIYTSIPAVKSWIQETR